MSSFDSFAVVDWSAASTLSPKRPSKDAIWIGIVRHGAQPETIYCRGRQEAEDRLADIIAQEQAAGRRLLLGFDFPFGYPHGFARRVAGCDDPLVLWDWLAARITDTADNVNNRFDVAEEITFPDHHEYPDRSLRRIEQAFAATGADAVLTTAKDRVKLLRRLQVPIAELPLSARPAKEFWSWLDRRLDQQVAELDR